MKGEHRVVDYCERQGKALLYLVLIGCLMNILLNIVKFKFYSKTTPIIENGHIKYYSLTQSTSAL